MRGLVIRLLRTPALCACFVSAVCFSAAAQETRFVRGDADASEAIDITDVNVILEFLFTDGQAPPCLDAADVNDDGAVDVSDAIFELLFLFGGGAPPREPSSDSTSYTESDCGTDPTPDGVSCL